MRCAFSRSALREKFDDTGIDDIKASDIAIETTANGISLTNADGKQIAVYTTNGTLIANIDKYKGEEITLEKGIYILIVDKNAVKIRL